MNYAFKAMTFAMEAHKDQKRKYTHVPYWSHLAEVAGIVQTVGGNVDAVAIAWLHDVIEDCDVTREQLEKEFNYGISEGVFLLSDIETGNRETRNEISRKRLAEAPEWVQDIKVADIISNTCSIMVHDPDFAVIYLKEKSLMLDVLTKADKRLVEIARRNTK